MSEVALADITKAALALPYKAQQDLLNALSISLKSGRQIPKHKHEENLALVKSFMGVSSCWQNENILEYQRELRSEYNE